MQSRRRGAEQRVERGTGRVRIQASGAGERERPAVGQQEPPVERGLLVLAAVGGGLLAEAGQDDGERVPVGAGCRPDGRGPRGAGPSRRPGADRHRDGSRRTRPRSASRGSNGGWCRSVMSIRRLRTAVAGNVTRLARLGERRVAEGHVARRTAVHRDVDARDPPVAGEAEGLDQVHVVGTYRVVGPDPDPAADRVGSAHAPGRGGVAVEGARCPGPRAGRRRRRCSCRPAPPCVSTTERVASDVRSNRSTRRS